MSTKNSQRRSKASTTTATPAPAPEVAVAPAVEPVVSIKVALPETPAAAPEASSLQRGSKRKAGAALEGGAEKKVKASKKAKDAAAPAAPSTTEDKKSRKKSKAASGEASSSAEAPKASSGKLRKSKAEKAEGVVAPEVAAISTVSAPVAAPEVEGETAAAVDSNPNVSRYLRSLLKSKYPESTISREAIQEVQRLVYQFGLHFLITAKRHLESAKKNTLMPPDVPICLQRVLSGSTLYSEFFDAAVTAIKRYCDSYQDGTTTTSDGAASGSKDVKEVVAAVDEKRKQMWAARAGLSIPPTRVKEFAKQYLASFRFSQLSITGLTALLERLAALLFQLSYDKAQELNRKRISQADVQSAVKGYVGLQWLTVAPQLPIV